MSIYLETARLILRPLTEADRVFLASSNNTRMSCDMYLSADANRFGNPWL